MTTESFEDFLELPRTTAECDQGPEVSMLPGLLTIRYDVETGAGRTWTKVRFPGAVALRVTPERAVMPMMARAYSKVGIIHGSAWVASLLSANGDEQLRGDLRHFVLFFDHHGSVETVASSCEVQEEHPEESVKDLFAGLTLPKGLARVIEQNLVELTPWEVMPAELAMKRLRGLRERYSRKYVPFARRTDNDDLACIDPERPEEILIVHDFSSEGFELRERFESFWDWFRAAVEAMIHFE